jgi:uncharacterized membrane protein
MGMKILKFVSITLLLLGFLLILTGLLSRIQHWPDTFKGMYSGVVIMITGALLFIVRLIKK